MIFVLTLHEERTGRFVRHVANCDLKRDAEIMVQSDVVGPSGPGRRPAIITNVRSVHKRTKRSAHFKGDKCRVAASSGKSGLVEISFSLKS